MNALKQHFDDPEWSRLEKGARIRGGHLGPVYTYVKEVLPGATILKLSSSFPLPEKTLREFCESMDRVSVVEELEPVIETAMQSMGLQVEGKELFPRIDEFSPEIVRQGFEKAGLLEVDETGRSGKFNR